MSQIEQIEKIIRQTIADNSNFQGIALLDDEGIILACELPADVDQERLVSMSISVARVGQTAAEELGRGILDQVYIKGEHGYLFFNIIHTNTILVSLISLESLLGAVLSQVRNLTEDVAQYV